MKTDIVDFYEDLKIRVYEYIETAYWTNDESFREARKQFIENSVSGPIFRDPDFEFLRQYKTSKEGIDHILHLSGLADEQIETKKLVKDFLNVFPPIRTSSLYVHQMTSIEEAINNKKNIVVTTGTGSGKSFCFMIPLMLSLLSEALGTKKRPRWSGAALSNTSWWNSPNSRFEPIRQKTNRAPAVRALIMYPLNALVQDQVDTFRSIFNSSSAEKLYKGALNEDRFFFGQYSGSTPGRGNHTSKQSRLNCRDQLLEIDKIHLNSNGDNPKIQRIEGSELITRWDIREFPPDVLITNYSMLSIMLMRDQDQEIFQKTREWLENPENRFFLILDELHSYRGTGGTEISYTIKAFLKKIGLSPNHDQLQIISTSASLSPKDGQSFLSDFFGTSADNPFKIINGPVKELALAAPKNLTKYKAPFIKYNDSEGNEKDYQTLLNKIMSEESFKSPEKVTNFIHDSLILLSEDLRKASRHKEKLSLMPLSIKMIAQELFDEEKNAVVGLIRFLTNANYDSQVTPPKTRMHVFVHNLDGIRRSMSHTKGVLNSPLLYDGGRSICEVTGAINLDVYYCQECGELYYSGYKNNKGGKLFVTNDDSNSDSEHPEMLVLHIPDPEKIYIFEGWQERTLNGYTGEICSPTSSALIPVFLKTASYNKKQRRYDMPNQCVACEANWKSKPATFVRSPIRSMGTGYNKFSQIIIEQLFGTLHDSFSKEVLPKLVVFSDSRREAAVISADIELNHYKDTVRAQTEKHLRFLGTLNNELRNFVGVLHELKETNSLEEAVSHSFFKGNYADASLLLHFFQGVFDPETNIDEIDRAKSLLAASSSQLVRFLGGKDSLVEQVKSDLLKMGINPAGLYQYEYKEEIISWQDAFIHRPKTKDKEVLTRLGISRDKYLSRLSSTIREVITSAMGRDFESLGYGWVTFDRNHTLANIPIQEVEFLDSVIRFLIKHYKTRDDEYADGLLDGYLMSYFSRWLQENKWGLFTDKTAEQISEWVKATLMGIGTIDQHFRIRKDGVFLHPSQDSFWRCKKCRTVHLFEADGRCRNVKFSHKQEEVGCKGELAKYPIDQLLNEINYYRSMVDLGRCSYALRTEELIGHTDKSDQRYRQLAFQGEFRGDITSHGLSQSDLELLYGIDILSVTTTMEAGVDIGSLKSIYMANMPPKRFNYQQRVGRAGRRDDRLSLAVTFCKGQKHDEYYFANHLLMVGWETKEPSLDTDNLRILERVLLRQMLYEIVNANDDLRSHLEDYSSIEGDFNNGYFGNLTGVLEGRPAIKASIPQVTNTIKLFVKYLRPEIDEVTVNELVNHVTAQLIEILDSMDNLIKKYGPNYSLTSALAEEGYLPLYGLPVRNVDLIHKDPLRGKNKGRWPIQEGIIDRSEDIALSEFSPGRSVVKDKKMIRSVGLCWPERAPGGLPSSRRIVYSNPIETQDITTCTSCGSILPGFPESCSECGAGDDDISGFSGWRPYAYVADVKSSKDYDGNIDVIPTSIIVHPTEINYEDTASVWQEESNFKVRGFQGRVIRANTNNNQGFSFKKIQNTHLMDGVYVEESLLNTGLKSKAWLDTAEKDSDYPVAIYSELVTDILIATCRSLPAENTKMISGKGHNDIVVKASWQSLSEIIGRQISLIEDIEPSEISVGKRFIRWEGPEKTQIGGWAIFVTDNLDNGAGYSSAYSRAADFRGLLNRIVTDQMPGLINNSHAHTCMSSCYHCLRNYNNRFSHSSLDWRLGLDLVNLLLDSDFKLSMKSAWWNDYCTHTLPKRLGKISKIEWEAKSYDDDYFLLIDKLNNKGLLVIHPMINERHESMPILRSKAMSDAGLDNVGLLDPFNFERFTITELQKVLAQIG